MSQRDDFLKFAISQIGTEGGTKYRNYYNKNVSNLGTSKWPWCAAGITYCAAKTNVSSKIIAPTASSSAMLSNFKNAGRFKARGSYIPKGGDIIIFKWSYHTSSDASHVGIVEYADDKYVHTIEFNSGSLSDGSVARWKYLLTNSAIVGYGIPNFKIETVKIVKRKSYIRKNPWWDPEGGTSKILKSLAVGKKVEHISDDGYGWSKVKCDGVTGYIQNVRLSKTGISKYRKAELLKATKVNVVGSTLKKSFKKGKKFTFICSIEKGKNKGKSIVRLSGVKYYIETSNLKILSKTLKK